MKAKLIFIPLMAVLVGGCAHLGTIGRCLQLAGNCLAGVHSIAVSAGGCPRTVNRPYYRGWGSAASSRVQRAVNKCCKALKWWR